MIILRSDSFCLGGYLYDINPLELPPSPNSLVGIVTVIKLRGLSSRVILEEL